MVQYGSHTKNAKSSTDDAVAVHSELLPHSTVVVCITVSLSIKCPLSEGRGLNWVVGVVFHSSLNQDYICYKIEQ